MADCISVQNALNERQAYYLGQTDRTNDQMSGYAHAYRALVHFTVGIL